MRNAQNLNSFIFIHINKTGGSSIEKALNLPFEHKTALEKIGEIGRQQWDSKFTFSVIRNPWDKVVSHYHYRVQTNQTGLGVNSIGFKEWVKLSYGNKDPLYYDKPKMFMPQFDWLTDDGGRVLVDFICRFENLADDFNVVCRKIGRNPSLPRLKASMRGNYSDYYDTESIEIVARWFSQDIENFGYTF